MLHLAVSGDLMRDSHRRVNALEVAALTARFLRDTPSPSLRHMANLYASLQVSPKKKRCPPDDDKTLTPKKMRTACVSPKLSYPTKTK